MEATFDYIVIGAGSAGCVLANRLSADPARRVLLLEAGPRTRRMEVRTPAAFSKLFKTDLDWNFSTVPQSRLDGRRLYQPRGKVVGGCSAINAMIYIRGNPLDYDHWAELGNEGWSWQEVLPYFLRSEDNAELDGPLHHRGGELSVCHLRHIHPIARRMLEAARAAGYPFNTDFNSPQQEGFGFYQVTQRRGRRCSAADAFLEPALPRPNLQLRTGVHVQRILFEGRRATGVEFVQGGQVQRLEVRGEVVLSAGAFGSPQLLLLSGIGPAEHLEEHGIPVVHHSPGVGRNLQDHLIVGVIMKAKASTLDDAERFPRILGNLARYLFFGTGPLTSNVAEFGGFWKSSDQEPAPDLQYHGAAAYYENHGLNPPAGVRAYGLGVVVLNPDSRGSVRLDSPNPFAPPRIDPNYLAEERDWQRLVKGFRIAQEICWSESLQPFRGGAYFPERKLENETDIRAFIRQQAQTLYHPVGTCKMGRDEQAVVDARLRVHGVEGLRVADASIMPTLVRGNTNAPVIMIAEKAADLILQDERGNGA